MDIYWWKIFFCLMIIGIVPLVMLNVFSDEYTDELVKSGLEQFSKNDTRSIEYFDKVLEIDPDNIKALYGKGSLLLLENKTDESLRYFDRILELEPENVRALINKGVALGHKNMYDEAAILLDKVIEIEPNNIDALINKSTLLFLQNKNWKEIIELLNKALEIEPNNIQASTNKKIAYKKMPTKPFDGIIQTIARDKNGNLLGYLESDNIVSPEYIEPRIFDNWISDFSKIESVEKQSDILITLRAINVVSPNSDLMRTGSEIVLSEKIQDDEIELSMFTARQNGFFEENGDVFYSSWHLVVPRGSFTK